MRPAAFAILACTTPCAAAAHNAFGDLGPFYANLLHPLADPAQGLLLAAVAVVLAAQPLPTVRPAYATLAVAGALAIVAGAMLAASPGVRPVALAAMALGLCGLARLRVGPLAASLIAAAAAIAAGLAFDLPAGARAASLALAGGALGMALFALLAWGALDLARQRIGPIAVSVAGSWVAAIGLMAAVLPPV